MPTDERRRSLLLYAAGALVLLFLATRVFAGGADAPSPPVAVDGAGAPTQVERRSNKKVWVHVAGAVRRPGLYRVRADARAGAAVDAAGGVSRKADLRAINLASTVRDGQQLLVPARGDQPAAPVAGTPAGDGTGAGAAGAKLSLASATVEQLDTLDGIGPTLAKRILEWRDAHGGFESIEQLREVEGIGDKRFEALRSAVQP